VLDGVTLSLHGRPLVPPVSGSAGLGDVLAIMGPSGVGKSALLAYVAGLLEPPLGGSGRVSIDGRDVTSLPPEERRIGLMFQDDLLFPHMDVLANLLFALPRGPRARREEAARAALASAGLAGYERRLPHALSGGQRSRVSLLRALLAAPRVLLLDEPFSRLDAALRRQMREVVWQALREQRLPALLVTHDPDDVPAGAVCVQLTPSGAADA
jgi:putative thiamine transport system ATP-binding protein